MSIVESMLENRKEKIKTKEEHENFDFDKFYTNCMDSGLLTPIHENIERSILNTLNKKFENMSDSEFNIYSGSYQISNFKMYFHEMCYGRLFGVYLKQFYNSDGTEYKLFGDILYKIIVKFLVNHPENLLFIADNFYPSRDGAYILEFQYLTIKGK